MRITSRAWAGTLESSDVLVEMEPAQEGIHIELESPVINQFGPQIRESVLDMLRQFGVEAARVRVVNRGALDCVLRARIETAILRGKGE